MCPTEIFWDEREEPSIKLLPIDTRASDDLLTYLKKCQTPGKNLNSISIRQKK